MKDQGWSLFRTGLRRRKKEVRLLRFMMGLAVFLTAFVLLFQDNINAYVMRNNYLNYGRWVFRTEEGVRVESPYLDWETVRVGGYLQKLYDLTSELDLGDEDGEPEPTAPEPTEPEDRIEVPERENHRQTSVLIGALTETFAAENELGLYEGRLPQTKDEIAMELNALQQLGLSYELGQEVSFYLAEPVVEPAPTPEETGGEDEEPETILVLNRVTFTLCGTLERYTARWDGGGSLPGALITEEAYDSLTMDKVAYDFGMLKPEYTGHSVWSFASELIDAVRASEQGADGALVANEAAYYNPFWGDPTLYRNMIAVLLLLCVSLVTYLMASYLTKRKRFFLRLREIGASTAEVWKLAAYECSLAVVPAVLAGIAAAYAVSLGAVFLMTRLDSFPWFYVFLWETLLRILLCVAVTFGVSLLAALLIFSGRGITEKRRGLSKRAAAALRRRATKQSPRLGYRETLKRERMSHSLTTVLRRLAAVLVCAVLVYSFDGISGAAKAYHRNFTPFTGMRTTSVSLSCRVPNGPKKTEKFDLGTNAPFLRNTIPEAFFAELAEKPGVASFTRILNDRYRAVSWDGKEENEAYRQYLETLAEQRVGPYTRENKALDAFLDKIDLTVFMISVSENAEAVWDRFGLKQEDPYYNAYLEGEAVVLGSTGDFLESAGLKPGDRLYLSGVNGELSVTVAALAEHITQGATLFGSAAFGAKLQALDGAEGQWNYFTTVFDSLSDKENTARALAELCTRYGLDYMDSTEFLKDIEDAYLRAWVTYGFFSLALLILFLFMVFTVSAERDLRLKDKRDLLRKLGAEEKAFAREKWREAIREALYGLAALPLALAARYYLIWKDLGLAGGASYYSTLLGRNLNYGEAFFETEKTDSRAFYALINTLETRSWLWLAIPLLIAAALTAFACGKTRKGDDNDR